MLSLVGILSLLTGGSPALSGLDTEKESRRILEKSPGSGADYLVNEGFGSGWVISAADKAILARQAAKVSHERGKPIQEIGEKFPFILKDGRGYYAEYLYVCIPETDPTRPLCPEGWEYQANTFSDSGPSTYQGLTTGKSYVAESWNGLGSCVRTIQPDPANGSYGGAESYGPVRLRKTARDYPQWLAKQKAAK